MIWLGVDFPCGRPNKVAKRLRVQEELSKQTRHLSIDNRGGSAGCFIRAEKTLSSYQKKVCYRDQKDNIGRVLPKGRAKEPDCDNDQRSNDPQDSNGQSC